MGRYDDLWESEIIPPYPFASDWLLFSLPVSVSDQEADYGIGQVNGTKRHNLPARTHRRLDQDLWKAFMYPLTSYMTDGPGKGDDSKVFFVPRHTGDIPGGDVVAATVRNMAVWKVGDSLMDGSSPICLPGSEYYSQALMTYLDGVQLQLPAGVDQIMTELQQQLTDHHGAYISEQTQAMVAYDADRCKPVGQSLKDWVIDALPPLNVSRQTMMAAQAQLEAFTEICGPTTTAYARHVATATRACDMLSLPNGHNMAVSSEAQLDSTAPALAGSRPAYTIGNGDYNAFVEKTCTFSESNSQLWSITAAASDGNYYDWDSIGYAGCGIDRSAALHFFTIRYQNMGEEHIETISIDSSSDHVTATLQAQAVKTFQVSRGSWDVPNVQTAYPKLRRNSTNPFASPGGKYRPDKILVGHSVSMQFRLSHALYTNIQTAFLRAMSNNGSVTLFGLDIGGRVDGSTATGTNLEDVIWDDMWTTIVLPAANDGVPTTVAILGKRVK